MNKLSQKILEKIEKEKVTPKSKWYFLFMHALLGMAVGGLIIISGIGVAIVIRHFTLTDWQLIKHSKGGNLKSILTVLPYLWLMFIVLVILIADKLFTQTKKGHRIRPWKIAAGSILISGVLGGVLFFTRIDKPIVDLLRDHVSPYGSWEMRRNGAFVSPEDGILAGQIITINSEEEWMLIDFKQKEWLIDLTEAEFQTEFEPDIGVLVGIHGMKMDDYVFEADLIGIWEKTPPFVTHEGGAPGPRGYRD